MSSPVGRLTLVATSRGLAGVLWENERPGRVKLEPRTRDEAHPVLLAAETQLHEYFAGERKTFDLPLAFEGTEFQKQVWSALLEIPYGETRSYMQLATSLQNPKAVRAVGAANGRNPLSIVAPCHRVIAANGDLTGFAGGIAAKEHLLRLESRFSK